MSVHTRSEMFEDGNHRRKESRGKYRVTLFVIAMLSTSGEHQRHRVM